MKYFIASCVFTERYTELSFRIQKYVADRFGMKILRCCVPNYMVRILKIACRKIRTAHVRGAGRVNEELSRDTADGKSHLLLSLLP